MPLKTFIAKLKEPLEEDTAPRTDATPAAARPASAAAGWEEEEEEEDSGLAPYLRLWVYERDVPELDQAFRIPAGCVDAWRELPECFQPRPPPRFLFLGKKGCFTHLHADPWEISTW